MENHYRRHLFSSVYYHNCYTKSPTFVYSLYELSDKDSFVGIASILPEMSLLIQAYFDIEEYVASLCGQQSPIRGRLCSCQGKLQATEMCQSLIVS